MKRALRFPPEFFATWMAEQRWQWQERRAISQMRPTKGSRLDTYLLLLRLTSNARARRRRQRTTKRMTQDKRIQCNVAAFLLRWSRRDWLRGFRRRRACCGNPVSSISKHAGGVEPAKALLETRGKLARWRARTKDHLSNFTGRVIGRKLDYPATRQSRDSVRSLAGAEIDGLRSDEALSPIELRNYRVISSFF